MLRRGARRRSSSRSGGWAICDRGFLGHGRLEALQLRPVGVALFRADLSTRREELSITTGIVLDIDIDGGYGLI
jgi:hypothetical protein